MIFSARFKKNTPSSFTIFHYSIEENINVKNVCIEFVPHGTRFGHVENVNFLYTKRTNFMVLNFYGSFLLRLRSRLIFVKVEIIDVCHRRNVVLKVVAIYIHRLVPHVLHNNRQIMF